jgi:ribosomal protein L3 glutamine methyltransferase
MRSAERVPAQPPTARDLIRDGVRRLKAAGAAYGQGTLSALDEAAYLTLHALKWPLDAGGEHLDRPLRASQVLRARALLERRIRERKPAAYLTHEAWLGDFRFYVDERVIVPRSYFAELLREDLAPWIARRASVRSALDLCTGSGCLAILLAHSFPRATIDAADISADALAVARRNVAAYRLGSRIRLSRADLFTGLAAGPYDLIVSNPPYVREAMMKRLPREFRREPRIALAGGRDGLDLVRRIVGEAPLHLAPGGLLAVEVGHQRPRVERAFPRLPLVWPETSGGDDCVFLVTREDLLAAAPARSDRASPAKPSPRAPASRRAAPA